MPAGLIDRCVMAFLIGILEDDVLPAGTVVYFNRAAMLICLDLMTHRMLLLMTSILIKIDLNNCIKSYF